MSEFSVPDIPISKDLIDRILFSISSRNAEAKVSECVTHVFGSKFADDPRSIDWQYIASGVTCLLRNRELAKNGKKYVWAMNLCLYNAHYAVPVWKGKLAMNCGYTAVANNFHVFALSEVDAVIGLLFSDQKRANDVHKTYLEWHQERMRDEKGKGYVPPQSSRFKKDMISRPCNFQHIQGTQALDECLEIEKIKSDIHDSIFGLGPRGRLGMDSPTLRSSGHGRRKKDNQKPRMEFEKVRVPYTSPYKLSASEPTLDTIPISEQPFDNRGSYPYEGDPNAVLYTSSPAPLSATYPGPVDPGSPTNHGNPLSPTIASLQSSLIATLGASSAGGGLPYETVPDLESNPAPYYNDQGHEPVSYEYDDQVPYQQEYIPPSANGFHDNGVHDNGYQGSQNSQEGPQQIQFEANIPSYNPGGNGNYGYNLSPPGRLDLNLEKEFSDSVLFKSTVVSTN